MAAMTEVIDRETGEIEPADFPDVRVDRKHVIDQQGRDHILFAGLVDALHRSPGGTSA